MRLKFETSTVERRTLEHVVWQAHRALLPASSAPGGETYS
jgi:hypothetical protein